MSVPFSSALGSEFSISFKHAVVFIRLRLSTVSFAKQINFSSTLKFTQRENAMA